MTEHAKKQWREFMDIGVLWWVNRILHSFGWAIVIEVSDDDHDEILSVYPARVEVLGFSSGVNKAQLEKFRRGVLGVKDEYRDPGTPQVGTSTYI